MSIADINSKFKAVRANVIMGYIQRGTAKSGITILLYTTPMSLTLSLWSAFFSKLESRNKIGKTVFIS